MKISTTQTPIDKVSADAIAIPVFENDSKALPQTVKNLMNSQVNLDNEFSGKLYETLLLPLTSKVLLVGAGKKEDFDSRLARNVAGTAVRRLLKSKIKTLAFDANFYENPSLIIEGAGLAEFDGGIYKTAKDKDLKLEELIIVGKLAIGDIKEALEVVETTNWVRHLIAEPANRLTPALIATEAKKIANTYKFDIEVFSEKEALKMGMGAFAGIAQGSHQPSYFVAMKYTAGKNYPTLGVVGKGITFDSGGISIKPSDKMHEMKMDMSGAAVAIGFMRLVGHLMPKVNVVVTAPLTENLPGGGALKPGDVVKSLSGKTIEVLNTDAEGRVVLADGLTYAQKLGATKIVDLATLTGAVLVALGTEVTGILGNDQEFVDQVIDSGNESGERMWQLPIYPEHKEMLRSDIADMANIPPSRYGGVIAGGVFLQEFINEKNSWAHLDIAGTAWLEGEKPYMAKGPTGVGVRTLLTLLKKFDAS